MLAVNNYSIKLNKFFQSLYIKKQYINKLKIELLDLQLNEQKNYKYIYSNILKDNNDPYKSYQDNLIVYVLDITFSKSNTLMHLMNTSGKVIFFCSAGSLNFKGKNNKKRRFLVFRLMYNLLLTKLMFLKNKSIALHLKNVGSSKSWLIRKLKSKFFIKIVKNFTVFPYNGCRKRKVKRKKIRTKKLKNKFFKKKKKEYTSTFI